MSAKDKSASFDIPGTYTEVAEYKKIKYVMDKADVDKTNREVEINFTHLGNRTTKIEEAFTPEEINSEERQRAGWSAILDNFNKFVMNN
jgi:uncharacterized protein YndB with AHSA1/START domain